MSRLRFGIVAGVVFGTLDILPMLGMTFPDKTIALAGAFASRFAIGFVIPHFTFPAPAAARGALVGVLLSLPDALLTGAWVPIIGTGVVGGSFIGWLAGRAERRHAAPA